MFIYFYLSDVLNLWRVVQYLHLVFQGTKTYLMVSCFICWNFRNFTVWYVCRHNTEIKNKNKQLQIDFIVIHDLYFYY